MDKKPYEKLERKIDKGVMFALVVCFLLAINIAISIQTYNLWVVNNGLMNNTLADLAKFLENNGKNTKPRKKSESKTPGIK